MSKWNITLLFATKSLGASGAVLAITSGAGAGAGAGERIEEGGLPGVRVAGERDGLRTGLDGRRGAHAGPGRECEHDVVL